MSIDSFVEVIPATQSPKIPKCQEAKECPQSPKLAPKSGHHPKVTPLASLQSATAEEEEVSETPQHKEETKEEVLQRHLTEAPSVAHTLLEILTQMQRTRRQIWYHASEMAPSPLLMTRLQAQVTAQEEMTRMILWELWELRESLNLRSARWWHLIDRAVWEPSYTQHKKRSSSRSYHRGRH